MSYNPIRKIVHNGRTFVVYAVKQIARRTGKAHRNWARYLTAKPAKTGTKLEIHLGFLSPDEVRAYVQHLPTGWSAAQVMWERLTDRHTLSLP